MTRQKTAIEAGLLLIFHPSTNNTLQSELMLQKFFLLFFILFPFPTGLLAWKEFFHCIWFPRSPSSSLSLDIESLCFLCPPARADPVSAWCRACIAIHSPHVLPKILCCNSFAKGSAAWLRSRSTLWVILLRVSCCYGWWMLLKEGLEKPDVTPREGWTPSSSGQLPFGIVGCYVGFFCRLLCSHWERVANVLDVNVFKEETESSQVVKVVLSLI